MGENHKNVVVSIFISSVVSIITLCKTVDCACVSHSSRNWQKVLLTNVSDERRKHFLILYKSRGVDVRGLSPEWMTDQKVTLLLVHGAKWENLYFTHLDLCLAIPWLSIQYKVGEILMYCKFQQASQQTRDVGPILADVGPSSTTLAQHQPNIGPTPRVCWDIRT